MAKGTEEKVSIAELIRRSDVARSQLGKAQESLRNKLDVQKRLKNSIKTKPLKWLGGTVAAGLLGSLLLSDGRRRETSLVKKVVGTSLTGSLLRLGFKMVKPALQVYATKMFKQYFEARLEPRVREGREVGVARQTKDRGED